MMLDPLPLPFLLLLSLLSLLPLLPPAQAQCPDVLPSITDKIINGNPTTPSFHVSLASPATPAIRRCTATRISQRWALTAAHCAVSTSWSARLQGSNVSNGTPVSILQVFPHPNYQQPTHRRFDIAALRLDAPPVAPPNIAILNSNPSLPEPGAFVRVAGYGANQSTFPAPHGLLTHVDIPVVPFDKCKQLYAGTANLGLLQAERQLCAGYLKGGCDACAGDSGGPIVQFDRSGRAVQVGLVSASRGCALPDFPGIAVRVDAYLPWLRGLGAVFRTGEGAQVFGRGSASSVLSQLPEIPRESPGVVFTPRPAGTEEAQPDSPAPSASPSDSEQGGVGKPIGPRLPPPKPTPANEELDGDEDGQDGQEEVVKPSADLDAQKGEALAGDVSVGGGIDGGGVNGGVVAGGVIGGLLVIAVFVVGALFFVKNRYVVGGLHVPRLEDGGE